MRQLGDFASWLGLILIVFSVIYFTPKLVDYVYDDSPIRAGKTFTPHSGGGPPARGNMAMNYPPGLHPRSPSAATTGMTR